MNFQTNHQDERANFCQNPYFNLFSEPDCEIFLTSCTDANGRHPTQVNIPKINQSQKVASQ